MTGRTETTISGDVSVYWSKYAGFDLCFEPDITLYHPARDTLPSLRSKNVRIGEGEEQLRQLNFDWIEKRPLLDIRNFLPRRPIVFLDEIQIEPRSNREVFVWYLLGCYIKFCRTWGRLKMKFDL